jgi:hypothetical protein
MKHIAKNYAQPWPLCWQLMQWDLVLWASLAQNNTHINVTWNEASLRSQIAPTDFQQSIQELNQTLTQQLGQRLVWRFDTQTLTAAHVIEALTASAAMDVTS